MMTNDEAQAAAKQWAGEAGGKLCQQLTENELAAIVNEAIAAERILSITPGLYKATEFTCSNLDPCAGVISVATADAQAMANFQKIQRCGV